MYFLKYCSISIFLFFSLFCYSQNKEASAWERDIYVGTWEHNGNILILDKYYGAKILWKDGSVGKGTWDDLSHEKLLNNWSNSGDDSAFCITLDGKRYSIKEVTTGKNSLIFDYGSETQTWKWKPKQRLNDAQVSAAILLGLLLFSDSDSSSGYQGEYSNDANTNRYLRNARESDARDRGF